ncbi:putative protease [Mariniphaga anaerophila]|uniref:Putative protease n=1 Tax=Mariniphaga anaerophila TaxID=1484053 RepID=A0A1M4T4F7_9BACT|nr:U32 family peptidase [Mariniphaga anaerophila]SHE39264.1 putative protease [Mariniphaga anaerophila]
MKNRTEIELLAPARNLELGKAAINYGADAVYIGASRFGARAAASNSLADIESLVQFAHKYKAKVYVTLNTILYNNELEEAEKLIHQIYNAGADALIIQDMGILKMNIPPIPLHASTQTNNFSTERICFFDQLGFDRIVLARELSLAELQKIRAATKIDLEYFVHGALCVSLSGQCYFSEVTTGRSANRGMCTQACRHSYNLVDGNGKRIILNSHLLSLKDLNLSSNLSELIHAGITSLKIEGRLKDINYIKNVVSYYRKKLNDIFKSEPQYVRSSSGNTEINFEPDPERSFNRQSTNYFLFGRSKNLINTYSPKSIGKKIGTVDTVGSGYITLNANDKVNNGDGMCFILNNELIGFRIEKVVDNKVFIADTSNFSSGTVLYRNYDHDFIKLLESDKSIRKVTASIRVSEKDNNLHFELTDEDKLTSSYIVEQLPETAKDPELAERNLISQLSKSGSSMFNVTEVINKCKTSYFFRISELNEIRRILFEKHMAARTAAFARKDTDRQPKMIDFPKKEVDFSENISNKKAGQFYQEHGVEKQEKAVEVSSAKENQLLMTSRYCLKYELGFCERFQGARNTPSEPLYLEDKNRKYLLQFDCKNCFMTIRLENKS